MLVLTHWGMALQGTRVNNPFWRSDDIWRHRSGSPLAQVMASCLTAPSHYLNQSGVIITEILWHLPDGDFTENTQRYISRICDRKLSIQCHDDVIKWKHFPRYSPFVRGIQRSPVNSPHKGQWRGALMFSLICAGINGWVNNREAGDLRHHRAHYDVTVMAAPTSPSGQWVKQRKMGHNVYTQVNTNPSCVYGKLHVIILTRTTQITFSNNI